MEKWQDTEQEYDKQLEHLVDAGNYSYDEARYILGEPPYELFDPAIADANEPIYTDEDRLYFRPYPVPISLEQERINRRGRALVRLALEAS